MGMYLSVDVPGVREVPLSGALAPLLPAGGRAFGSLPAARLLDFVEQRRAQLLCSPEWSADVASGRVAALDALASRAPVAGSSTDPWFVDRALAHAHALGVAALAAGVDVHWG